MEHLHAVIDNDPYFIVDAESRTIEYSVKEQPIVIQGDHNSERFTFQIPRYIEGHEVMACNYAQIHYINIASNGSKRHADVYPIEDMRVDDEDKDYVLCSWLVSQNATMHIGSLNFVLRLACVVDKKITYSWSTSPYTGIIVGEGIDNEDSVVEQYSDILEEWKASLFNTVGAYVDGDTLVLNNRWWEVETVSRALFADEATHSEKSDEADHAVESDQAKDADNANNAKYAERAGHAATADQAAEAVEAQHAVSADEAKTAMSAGTAAKSYEADHAAKADEADHAEIADHATSAVALYTDSDIGLGHDLNDYLTVGNYRVTTDDLAKTISNIPHIDAPYAGILIVSTGYGKENDVIDKNTTWSNRLQVYFTHDGYVFIRRIECQNGVLKYHDWRQFLDNRSNLTLSGRIEFKKDVVKYEQDNGEPYMPNDAEVADRYITVDANEVYALYVEYAPVDAPNATFMSSTVVAVPEWDPPYRAYKDGTRNTYNRFPVGVIPLRIGGDVSYASVILDYPNLGDDGYMALYIADFEGINVTHISAYKMPFNMPHRPVFMDPMG